VRRDFFGDAALARVALDDVPERLARAPRQTGIAGQPCKCSISCDGGFLLAVFVVSGFTGLIYESIWSHYLKLFLGHAAYAQTLVLAIFMGGMALGSWTVAHYSSRIRQLLWGYVLVEGLIGILGIFFTKHSLPPPISRLPR